jgi:outer membrane lipoprotein SlyB
MIKQTVLVCALAMGLGACATSPGYYERGSYGGNDYAYCQSCGVVERIEQYYGERRSSGGGAVAGAIIGGVLGNQIGSGSGRAAATAAGAIAGGVAGNQIEKNTRGSVRYDLFVRMDDGRRIVLSQRDLRGIREGSRIQVRGNSARLY